MREIFFPGSVGSSTPVTVGDLTTVVNNQTIERNTAINTAVTNVSTLLRQEFNTELGNQSNALTTNIQQFVSNNYLPNSTLGSPNGVATLGSDGKVPSAQLPSYVDDVVEYPSAESFPEFGESGKIYVDTTTGGIYRWSGSGYINIVASPGTTDNVVEGSVNLYFTPARAAAAAPVRTVAGKSGDVVLNSTDIAGMPTKVSDLINDLGFISSGQASVLSVAGRTGNVLLSTSDISGISTVGVSGSYLDLSNKPTIPSKTSELANDLNFVTPDTAPVKTVAGKTGNVSLNAGDIGGLSSVSISGSYTDLINKPIIPNKTSQLLNDSGYLTSVVFPVTKVAGRTGDVYLTKADISDLSTLVSQFANDVGYVTATTAPVRSVAGRTGAITLSAADVSGVVASSEKGVANGVATLGGDGKVPSAQLPSFVDDVLEFNDLASFPPIGESGKIYVTADTNKTYRWSGSIYVEISAAPGSTDSVTEGALNKYFTTARASAAAPVQSVAGRTGAIILSKSDISGLSTVAGTGSYLDLSNKPTIPSNLSQLSNDVGFITTAPVSSVAGRTGAITLSSTDISGLSTVASTGSYSDLSGKPTIPSKTSQLTNDSNFITSGGAPVQSVAGRTGVVTLSTADISGMGNYLLRDGSVAMTGQLNGATIASTTANGTDTTSVLVRNNGGTGDTNVAALGFLCSGSYGIKMHLRADGVFGIGGWSRSAWSWYTDGSGNMVAAGDVTAYSDPRLKENFKRIEKPLEKLELLTGGTFNWKFGIPHIANKAGRLDYGILADQVQTVMPEIVYQSIDIEGETYRTVAYEKMIPLLIEAIKELKNEIEILKSK